MKLKELYELLNGSLEVIEKTLDIGKIIYIFDINIDHKNDNTALININASGIEYNVEVRQFIYSTLYDLDDIEWVDYYRYDVDEDLYYFGVEFKEEI